MPERERAHTRPDVSGVSGRRLSGRASRGRRGRRARQDPDRESGALNRGAASARYRPRQSPSLRKAHPLVGKPHALRERFLCIRGPAFPWRRSPSVCAARGAAVAVIFEPPHATLASGGKLMDGSS
jgi:hypothetical protein